MRIFQVFNEYRSVVGGEPAIVDNTLRALAEHGHQPRLIVKSSRALEHSLFKRACAFWGGIYNVSAYRDMRRLLETDRPDVVHVHGVYPMFSPSILVACRRTRVPVVMTIHNYNLTCPTWYHLCKGRVCEACVGGKEYHCVLKNCRNNIPESLAYALRSAVARRFRLFHDNLDMLIANTPFTKTRLVQAGFREERIAVVPNPTTVREAGFEPLDGEYVAFAGRMSPEKGVDVLLKAAVLLPEIPFKIAGDGPELERLRSTASPNVEFMGKLDFDSLVSFYRKSRVVVVPSLWFESFPMVIVDAMTLGLPLVASRIGGLPYMVEDGATGLLFEPGNSAELAGHLRGLWDDRVLRRKLGNGGRDKAMRQYSRRAYYDALMDVYERAAQYSKEAAQPRLI